MARYFFNVAGAALQDVDGYELADEAAARDAAVRLAGEMIAELRGFWIDGRWRLDVSDARGPLFTLELTARDRRPASGGDGEAQQA